MILIDACFQNRECRWVKNLLLLTRGGVEWSGWLVILTKGSALHSSPRVKPVLGISALIGTRCHTPIPHHVH